MLASLPLLLSCVSFTAVGLVQRDYALFPIGDDIVHEISQAIDNTIHIPTVNNSAILNDIRVTINDELNVFEKPLEKLDGGIIGKIIQDATEKVSSKIFGLKDQLAKNIESGLESLVGKSIPFPV